MRVELRGGQWAELRERIDHGAHKRIKVGIRKAGDDDVAAVDLDDVVIREFVTAWSIKDINGVVIDLAAADALDRLPSDIADALVTASLDAYQGATVPNPSTGN
jgi:hypothetical protein